MDYLTREQAIKKLKEQLREDIEAYFIEQEKYAGDHGDSSFLVRNREGETVQVGIDWNKEADELVYTLNARDSDNA
ncbi:hypothetical protein [Oceanobacillus massiliensis]|uniref:hypothetical protein n=1 Tax=Oceanobacillus massiliensis TaxID=1465765 RepID=UPI00028919AD|nr:hypothetical protein [Oceanobacillus massiliensis]